MVGEIFGEQGIIVLVIILVLFGSAKLPQLARSLGQAKKEFSAGLGEDAAKHDDPAPDPSPEPAEQDAIAVTTEPAADPSSASDAEATAEVTEQK